jgi:hypothetical protein
MIAATNMDDNNDDSVEARRARFTAEIEAFIANRRAGHALTAAEIGRLGKGRLGALTKTLVLMMPDYYSANQNADAAPGVAVLLCAFSDNDTGICTLSIDRMALFLRRSANAVSAAIGRLEGAGLVTVHRVPGHSSKYVVSAPRVLAVPTQLTWVLDALAPSQAPKKHGVRRDGMMQNNIQGGLGPVADSQQATLPAVLDNPQVGTATAPQSAYPDSPSDSPIEEEEGALDLKLTEQVYAIHRQWWRGRIGDEHADRLINGHFHDACGRGISPTTFAAIVDQIDAGWRANTVRAPEELISYRIDQRAKAGKPEHRKHDRRTSMAGGGDPVAYRFNGQYGCHVYITNADIQAVLSRVPGATTAMVQTALVEVDQQLVDRRSLAKHDILHELTLAVLRYALHAEYGPPVKQLGGDQIAVVGGQSLLGSFGAIGAHWLLKLLREFRAPDDLILSVWIDILVEMGPGRQFDPGTYGQGLQTQIEATFAERLRERAAVMRAPLDANGEARVRAARDQARHSLLH